MKVLIVADKEKTAIHRLSQYIQKANPHHQFRIVCVHPKRPSVDQLTAYEEGYKWCDIVHFNYWKSAELIRSMFEVKKPCMLSHHNPYDITQQTWTDYKLNVVNNREQATLMKCPLELIGLPVDINFWKFQPDEDYTEDKMNTVIMVAARIEGKKGVLPVAQACHRLGMRMILVGRPSDPAYLQEILQYDEVDYFEDVSDERLRDLYYQSGIHVCNSIDFFESGTMPILEAMACGVPVLTRKVGHVPDLYDGNNMVVRGGKPDELDDLSQQLDEMRKDRAWMLKIREAGWDTARKRHIDIFGRLYSKLYYKLILGEKPLISVIIPTYNRAHILARTLASVITMDYPHLEVVIADDGSTDGTKEMIEGVSQLLTGEHTSVTFKYLRTDRYEYKDGSLVKVYGIAHSRNMAIMEAEGEYMMFLDDRLAPNSQAANIFLSHAGEGLWLWGSKDGSQKGFVENFSFIRRSDIIRIGGFSGWITQYGGMTQEVRKRAERNHIAMELVGEAKATSLHKSGSKWNKLGDIAKSKIQCYKLGYD